MRLFHKHNYEFYHISMDPWSSIEGRDSIPARYRFVCTICGKEQFIDQRDIENEFVATERLFHKDLVLGITRPELVSKTITLPPWYGFHPKTYTGVDVDFVAQKILKKTKLDIFKIH